MKRGLVVRGIILVGATPGIALTSAAGNAAYAERASSGEEKDIPRAFRVLDSAPDESRVAVLDAEFPSIRRNARNDGWVGTLDGLSPEQVLDLHTISRTQKIDSATALAQMKREQACDGAVSHVRTAFLDRYVSARLTAAKAQIFVTGARSDIEAAVAARSNPIFIEVVGGYQLSHQEVLDEHRQIGEALDEGGIQEFTSEVKPITSEVVVASSDPKKSEDILSGRQRSQAVSPLSIRHEVLQEHPDSGPDSLLRGGAHLENCTSGFVLRGIAGGTKRLGTAAHCGYEYDRRAYRSRDESTSTEVQYLWTHFGENGDIAYTSPGTYTPYPSFYAGVNEVRAVRKVTNNFYEGRALCRFGKESGNSCGTARGIFLSRKAKDDERYPGVTAHNLASVRGATGIDGDSGGPFYAPHDESAAAGIYSGKWTCWATTVTCAQFTPVSAYHQYGLEVWTL